MLNKIDWEKQHSAARALKRYGLELTDDLRKMIIQTIQDSRSKRSCAVSHGRSIHVIEFHRGDDVFEVPVVYDKHRKELITFLPPEELKLV